MSSMIGLLSEADGIGDPHIAVSIDEHPVRPEDLSCAKTCEQVALEIELEDRRDIVLPEAARHGLDGLFLLSVVRQESLFEGFATSVAAARGLMQVIPSTGASIADQLGWPPDYETRDLYRPIVSVRFGTHYLGAQRDRFEGDLFAALAAYNGGPGNSIAWKELAPDDPDLFLEVIRFAETHRYIQVIYEVFEIYKGLYASG